MSLLFDTPGLAISAVPIASSTSTSTSHSKKRKHDSTSTTNAPSTTSGEVEINLDKLMKNMRKLESNNSSTKGSTSNAGPAGAKGKGKGKPDGAEGRDPKKQKKELQPHSGGHQQQQQQQQQQKKQKHEKKDVNRGSNSNTIALGGGAHSQQPSSSSSSKKDKKKHQKSDSTRPSTFTTPSDPLPDQSSAPKKSTLHTGPKQVEDEEEEEREERAPQTAMQKQLRAKLAGGRFRMLNESLYTSTGEEARVTMKDEGAFDDYHAGFRSQSSHWPVQPLTLLTTQLLTLPKGTFIADFGCGDAQLARSLVPSGLPTISFDLVSKDGWVIEAECSSVPLPGESGGGMIVNVVVCCLSLMGTDWVNMVFEARRVLKDGGKFKVAEVTSRFTNIDTFVALITSIGFTLLSKDTTNTHFVMFDFEKTSGSGGSEFGQKRASVLKKAEGLLKPCVYKKRG